jgi:hypothetical protein
MRQKRFEKSVIGGIKNVLNNPENYVIDGGYYTNGNHIYQTEYYVFSNKDKNVVFYVCPGSFGNKLSIGGNNVIISKDKFDNVFDLTRTRFSKQSPEINQEKIQPQTDSIKFLADFGAKIDSKLFDYNTQSEYEQKIIAATTNVLNNSQNFVFQGIKSESSTFYVYSGLTNQRLYFVEFSPLLCDQYVLHINYQPQPLSRSTLKTIFDITKSKHDQNKKLSDIEEHQQFILQYLSDYSLVR